MAKEVYITKSFRNASLANLVLINEILTEYGALGYTLTLRQLYYQMVARGHIENSQKSYDKIGNLVSDARLAGLVDWDMIVDRTRSLTSNTHWTDPAHIVDAAARQFQINKWEGQEYYIEVMVEKQALEGILIPVCNRLDISFMSNRGYNSSTVMRETGKRLRYEHMQNDKKICVFYLGDHDPSGMDMTRDIEERLYMFSRGIDMEMKRLALNMDQVQMWNPPENPAKETDSRYQKYVDEFGEYSWELDAIEPRTLESLITDAVLELRDEELWDEKVAEEDELKGELQSFVIDYRKRNGNGSI